MALPGMQVHQHTNSQRMPRVWPVEVSLVRHAEQSHAAAVPPVPKATSFAANVEAAALAQDDSVDKQRAGSSRQTESGGGGPSSFDSKGMGTTWSPAAGVGVSR